MVTPLLIAISLVLADPAAEAADAGPSAAGCKIELQKADDRAELTSAEGRLTVDLRSQSGIGRVTLTRTAKAWPEKITLRLHLAGLEMFRVRASDLLVTAAVSSARLQSQRVSQMIGKDEVPCDPKDPLWVSIQAFDKQGQTPAKIPLTGGWFEITLPPALWKDNPDEIELEWIDFYRG